MEILRESGKGIRRRGRDVDYRRNEKERASDIAWKREREREREK